MGELKMEGKVDNGISENTKVVLPLPLQITIWISIIIITASVVAGYFNLTGKDESHDRNIIELKEQKLDKTTYDKDRSNDAIRQETNGKKLDAIMRKLNIENY